MANPVWQNVLKKIRCEHLLEYFEGLSISELNSLLLEVFKRKATSQAPSSILKGYHENRFVRPSTVDPIVFMELELLLLRLATEHDFRPLVLAPLAPLGSCSVFALADQNKVVSAIRGTEVVADATNILALEAAQRRRAYNFNNTIVKLCTAHRHVRAQALSGKGFTAHFGVFCMVSSGKDRGNLRFEREVLQNHLAFYHDFLSVNLGMQTRVTLKVISGTHAESFGLLAHEIASGLPMIDIGIVNVSSEDHRYYYGLRFSIDAFVNENEYNIGDGGFVNWPVALMSNKKERMLTSGIGTELLYKIKNDLL